MSLAPDFSRDQLVLSRQNPQWGYGRILETAPGTQPRLHRVYFYFTDRVEQITAEELTAVPDNYQPPFAPDPQIFFAKG